MDSKIINRILIISLVFLAVLISEQFFYNKKLYIQVDHYLHTKGLFKISLYLISYTSTIALYLAAIFIRSKIISALFLISLFISYYTTTCYVLINGYGIGLTEIQILNDEAGKHTADAISSYGRYFIISFFISAGIITLALLLRKWIFIKNLFIKNRTALIIGLFSVVTSLGIAIKTTNTMPKFPTLANFYNTLAYYKLNSTYYGDREPLNKQPSNQAEYNNIIWMIDESISGHYLSINGFPKESTPYLKSISDHYTNLGIASSAANCSAPTNIMLMSGTQINQLPDKENYSLKAPSIFQYAKNANYKTHYISGQSNGTLLQNYMTKFDLDHIDNFYQPSESHIESSIPEEDIIEKTKEALKKNKKNFIFIVKRGAHFQWEGKYPLSKAHFKPHLSRFDSFDFVNRDKAINSYLNLIRYITDDFLKVFFKRTKLLDDTETLLIYTSDHGQSILENNKRGTQCDSKEPSLSQGKVPFLIFDNKNQDRFKSLGKDKFSHFEIFPTTLEFMGYENQTNGKTIFNKESNDRIFFSGDLFGRASANFNDLAAE